MRKFLGTIWGKVIFGTAVVLIIFILQQTGALGPIENATAFSLRPIQTFFSNSALKIKNFFVYFNDIDDLKRENTTLSDRVRELSNDNLKLKTEISENELITNEYEFIREFNQESVIAKIIGRGADGLLQVIIINKGSANGIQKDYPVTANNGYLIGKIIETTSKTSKILLLNDIHSQISSIINNDQRSPGITIGQFGISIKMELIPEDHYIIQGQSVITSGNEKYIPANLLIGTVSRITRKDGELFQEATVEPGVDYQNLSIVSVIIPTNE